MNKCSLFLFFSFSVLPLAGCLGTIDGQDPDGDIVDGGRRPDGEPPAAPIEADQFCATLSAIVCDVNEVCCGGLVVGEESCQAQQLTACDATVGALIADPRTGYDPQRAAAYLSQLQPQSSGCFASAPPRLADLLGIFAGTGEQGADCTPASDSVEDVRLAQISCAEGLTCDLTLRADRSVRGECLPADGEGCSHPFACGASTWCDLPDGWTPGRGYGDCKPLKVDGWSCTSDAQCESQLCHSVTRTCAPAPVARYCVATTYQDNVLAHAPIAYWRLGDANGGTVQNHTEQAGLDGSYLGSPGSVEGALMMDDDGAMALDGVDDAAELPELQSRFTSSALSLELWFRRNADSAMGPLLEFRRGEEERGVYVWNHPAIDQVNVNVVGVGGANHSVHAPTGSIEPDTWYHVVGTYDGSVVRLYLNGSQLGDPHTATFAPRVEGLLRIGLRVDDERRITGAIDEVAVYGRALSAAQVRAHYQRGTQGPQAKSFILFDWLD